MKIYILSLLMLLSGTLVYAQELTLPYVIIGSPQEYNLSYMGSHDAGWLNIPISMSNQINIISGTGIQQYYIDLLNQYITESGYGDLMEVRDLYNTSMSIFISENMSEEEISFTLYGDMEAGTNFGVTINIAVCPPPPPPPPPLTYHRNDYVQEQRVRFSIPGNWIFERTYTSESGSTYYEDITFYDGLGYPDQVVNIGASYGTNKNIVTPIYYDNMRRSDARTYMPYVSTNNTKVKEGDPFNDQNAYYTGKYTGTESGYTYSRTHYEASTLNRITSTQKQGSAYNNKTVNYGYAGNTATEVLKMNINSSNSLVVNTGSKYAAGTLYKNTIVDEDGSETITFTDKQGNTILERKKISSNTYADTYYVYNDKGQLGWVISPKGTDALTTTTHADTSTFAQQHCYVYKYDGRGNLVEKRIPSKGLESYVYDEGNRLVLSQDAVQASKNPKQWTYNIYDNHDQLIERHLVTSSMTRTAIQDAYYATTFNNSYPTLGSPSDRRKPLPGTSFTYVSTLMQVRYYGNTYYGNTGGSGTSFTMPAALAQASVSNVVASSDFNTKTHGMKAYEKVWSLNNTSSYVERAFYYDYRGRLIQTVEKNTLGGISRTSIKYDYNDNITAHHESHQTSVGATADTKLTTFTYDNRGRLLSENTKVNSTTAQVSTTYTYNELGQPQTKTYGNGIKETMTYNIQGWMTNKVAKLSNVQQFNLDLRYYTKEKSASTVRYNGNISEIEWQQGNTSSSDRYTYAYTYDLMNRLTNTTRYTGTSTTATNAYTEKGIGYDKNGNITTLARYGNSSSTTINNLSYAYTGNRLTSLTDNGGTAKTYSYDNNGNMTVDGRRGMNIQYNLLNLPKAVEQQDGAVTLTLGEYTYLADGTKVEAVNGNNAGYTYLGSLIYRKSGSTRTLEKAMFSDGVVLKNGSTYEPRYYTTDHLGSIRIITKANGAVDERSDYYPFGLEAQISGYPKMISNYTKFSSKEDQKFVNTNFNYLDFGARMYDPVIGRWSTVDPMANKYYGWSGYNYCLNNPVIYIDPDGRRVIASNISAQQVILNTLPREVRSQIQFGGNGYINRELLNKIDSNSGNLSSLKELVNSDMTFEVIISNEITYRNENGKLSSEKMNVYKTDFSDGDFGFNTGEEGWLGVTQTPGNDSNKYNSPTDNIIITVNKGLTPEGQAQIFSHEAYGHALLYSQGKDHKHKVKKVQSENGSYFKETNSILADYIRMAIQETINNMK